MFQGDRMAAARVEAGLTQAGLATLTGTSRSRISGWECGRTVPSRRSLARIATVLRININDLMSADGAGRTLRDLRSAAGLSVQQVTAVGISPQAYLQLESGQRGAPIPTATVMRLAVIFGVTEADIGAAVELGRTEHGRQRVH